MGSQGGEGESQEDGEAVSKPPKGTDGSSHRFVPTNNTGGGRRSRLGEGRGRRHRYSEGFRLLPASSCRSTCTEAREQKTKELVLLTWLEGRGKMLF